MFFKKNMKRKRISEQTDSFVRTKRGNRSLPVACSFICLVRRMHTHACASVLDKHIDKWADVVLHAAFRRLHIYTLAALWRADTEMPHILTKLDAILLQCPALLSFSFFPLRILHYILLFLFFFFYIRYFVTVHLALYIYSPFSFLCFAL